MTRIRHEQQKLMKCTCSLRQLNRFDDFITRIASKLRSHRKQHWLAYGTMVELFLEEANLTYIQAHQLSGWELRRIYRELCNKEEIPKNKYTIKWHDPEGEKITIGGY